MTTASLPITALDTLLLGQQLTVALARIPLCRPLEGHSTRGSNLGQKVTRSIVGYVTSLPVPESRSIEQLLDDLRQVVMPPEDHARGVAHAATSSGDVPGIRYVPRGVEPRGVILYLHGGCSIGTSPAVYASFASRIAATTGCAMARLAHVGAVWVWLHPSLERSRIERVGTHRSGGPIGTPADRQGRSPDFGVRAGRRFACWESERLRGRTRRTVRPTRAPARLGLRSHRHSSSES